MRLIRQDDAAPLASLLEHDREAMRQWEPARPDRYYTSEGQAERIARLLLAHDNDAGWPGVIVSNGEPIGQVTVSSIMRFPFERAFIGYWVASAHRGCGHATAAVAAVLDVMRERLKLYRVEAHTQLENVASQQVLRRNGFVPFAVAPEHIFIDGAWRDDILWQRVLREGPPPAPG